MSFHVTGPCSAHATVTVTGPSGPYSAVTNSLGGASVNVTASGVYSWSVSMNGYAPITGTIVLRCGVTPATTNVAFGALPYGYTCAPPGCCTEEGPPYAPFTYPGTLFFNDGLGTISLAGDGNGAYTGSASRLASEAFDVPTCTWVPNVNVTIHIRAFCGWVDGYRIGQRNFTVFVSYHTEKDPAHMCGTSTPDDCLGFTGAGYEEYGPLCTSEDVTCRQPTVGFGCPDASSTCSPFVVNGSGSTVMDPSKDGHANEFSRIYGHTANGYVAVGGTITS